MKHSRSSAKDLGVQRPGGIRVGSAILNKTIHLPTQLPGHTPKDSELLDTVGDRLTSRREIQATCETR